MKLYWINIRTLEVFEDKEGFIPKHYEWGKIAENKQQFIEMFVDMIESIGKMHSTFNTSAKKDVVKFILDKQ